MTNVIADETLQAELGRLTEPTEIRDSGGNLLGYYTSAAYSDAMLYRLAAAHFDPAELKRRKADGTAGFTTPQVLDHLKSLERAGCATP